MLGVDESLAACKKKPNPQGKDCADKKIIKKIQGWTNATIEASLVLRYAIAHGRCPRGQRTSCQ